MAHFCDIMCNVCSHEWPIKALFLLAPPLCLCLDVPCFHAVQHTPFCDIFWATASHPLIQTCDEELRLQQ